MPIISVTVTSAEEVALNAEANAHGISIESLIRKAILQLISSSVPPTSASLTAEEFDRAFDEIADMIPQDVHSVSDEAPGRESIYTREDEWDRN